MSDERHQSLLAQARSKVVERRWYDAAEAFASAASELRVSGRSVEAQSAYASGGDAAWRADLLDLAMRCFVRARELLPEGSPLRAVRAVQMACVLVEFGELDSSALLLDEAEQDDPPRELLLVLLDTRMAIELLRGRVGRAQNALVLLESLVPTIGTPVLLFRRGQIASRLGRFTEAVDALSACSALVQREKGYDGPLGAAVLELAEVALFREEHDEALALLDRASAAWKRAGRGSGVMRVEAARMRLLGTMGAVDMLTSGLDRSISVAQERDMLLLEAELRLANGICLLQRSPECAVGHLDRAAELAGGMGAMALRGRALLARHDRPDGEREALEQACVDLVELTPWRSRAYLALARKLGSTHAGREEALEISASMLCRFSSMDLPADEARARTLLWKLSAGK